MSSCIRWSILTENAAQRIKDRAIRRGGELLAQVKAATNQHDARARVGALPSSRKEAATNAGLSPYQAKQMVRVASVPEQQFELMVEAKKPATGRAARGSQLIIKAGEARALAKPPSGSKKRPRKDQVKNNPTLPSAGVDKNLAKGTRGQLAGQKKGDRPGGLRKNRQDEPTLLKAGVDKNLLHNAHKDARLDDDQFEMGLDSWRELQKRGNGHRIPTNLPIRQTERAVAKTRANNISLEQWEAILNICSLTIFAT